MVWTDSAIKILIKDKGKKHPIKTKAKRFHFFSILVAATVNLIMSQIVSATGIEKKTPKVNLIPRTVL